MESAFSFYWASCGFDYADHYLDNLQKVTRADIKKYVDTYIKGKPCVVGIGGPEAALSNLQLNPAEVLQ